jgi:hypothetical protein
VGALEAGFIALTQYCIHSHASGILYIFYKYHVKVWRTSRSFHKQQRLWEIPGFTNICITEPAQTQSVPKLFRLCDSHMESRTCLVCRDLQELKSISYESIYCKALEGCPSCSLLLSVILRFFDRQEKIQSLTVQPGESNEKGPLILQVSLETGIERGIELFRQLGNVHCI